MIVSELFCRQVWHEIATRVQVVLQRQTRVEEFALTDDTTQRLTRCAEVSKQRDVEQHRLL